MRHVASTGSSSLSVTLVVESYHLAHRRMHAYLRGIGATRLGATAPSNAAIHVVPKRPSLRVYDPFYGRPPAARHTAATQPLFLPIGKVNSRRVSPVIARTQIGFIHGQPSCTRVRASRFRAPVLECLKRSRYGRYAQKLAPICVRNICSESETY